MSSNWSYFIVSASTIWRVLLLWTRCWMGKWRKTQVPRCWVYCLSNGWHWRVQQTMPSWPRLWRQWQRYQWLRRSSQCLQGLELFKMIYFNLFLRTVFVWITCPDILVSATMATRLMRPVLSALVRRISPIWLRLILYLDVDECALDPCVAPSECRNTDGSYECECPQGYVKENGLCMDVDECQ